MELRLEKWKTSQQWTVRDKNGRFVTTRKFKKGDTKQELEQRLKKQRIKRQPITLSRTILSKRIIGKSKRQESKQVVQYITEKREYAKSQTQLQLTADVFVRDSPRSPERFIGKRTGYSRKGVEQPQRRTPLEFAKANIIKEVAQQQELLGIMNYGSLIRLANQRITYIAWRLE